MWVVGDIDKKWNFYHFYINKNNNFVFVLAFIKSIQIYSSFKKDFKNVYTFAQLLNKNTDSNYNNRAKKLG